MTRHLLFVVPLVAALAGCGGKTPRETAHETEAEAPAVPVNVVAAANEQWPALYEATGTVRARWSAAISSKWMGYVREVKVQVGDRVRKGQMLVQLDARDLDASYNRAAAARDEVRNAIPEADSAMAASKAQLDLAEATFRRMRELYEKKSISDHEFDESTAKLKGAEADYGMMRARRAELDSKLAQAGQEVQSAEVTRSYAVIQSPVDGVVTAKSVDPGDLAAPGAPLLTIEGGGYRFEASVEESKLASIRMRQAVSVTLDGMDKAVNARVSEIAPSVDSAARAYTVKIDLPVDAAIRSGIFGRAEFPLGSRWVLAVPSAAVVRRGQLESVFVAENNIARSRLVTLGDQSKDRVEVLSGVNAGDQIIVPVPRNLADGSKVEVRP